MPLMSELSVSGLNAAVDVLRDGLGVPHVRASNIHDAFFAQGFVHAQDRLWQMELDRMKAAGRVSELLGAKWVTYDIFVRRLGLPSSAQRDFEGLQPETQNMLAAYTAGINAAIQAGTTAIELETLGHTPAPWNPWDPGAAMKVRHVFMGPFGEKLWRIRLAEAAGMEAVRAISSADSRDELLIVPPGRWETKLDDITPLGSRASWEGSNNWAVDGSRTASGLPLIAGDPHRTLETPNVYYQNHITCPDFDAIGLSMPGIPGIFHFGHNTHAAWCITHAMGDSQDLFIQRFNNEGEVLTVDGYKPCATQTHTVKVRNGEPVTFNVTSTAHGPVLFGDPSDGTAISMMWTATDGLNTTMDCVLPLLRARTVQELDEAVRGWVDPCNAMITGDVHGNIGFIHRGRAPVRSAANMWGPVPAWTGEHDWHGEVEFSELPRLLNPEAGWIATANNRVTGSDYPHHLGIGYAAPYRAQRIAGRLSELSDATVPHMMSIHADRVSVAASGIVDALVQSSGHTGHAAAALELLIKWDGLMDASLAAPAIYAATRHALAEIVVESGPIGKTIDNPFPEEPEPDPVVKRVRGAIPYLLATRNESVLGSKTWDEMLREALARGCARLHAQVGGEPASWRWGEFHHTAVKHPLGFDQPDIRCGGDGETVNATGSLNGLTVTAASVARYVFDISNWDASVWVVPFGSSGHPDSPHYSDQAQRWGQIEAFAMPFTTEAVDAAAASTTRLVP